MEVDITILDNAVKVEIPSSGLAKVVRPGSAFHGVIYRRLRRLGNGRHWLKERGNKKRAD